MTAYTAETIDISRLDGSPLVDIDIEAIIADRLDGLLAIWATMRKRNPLLPDLNATNIESSPILIGNEHFAYGEQLILQAINETADRLRLVSATGSDLENLSATYHGTMRQTVVPATVTSAAILETDTQLRLRSQMSPEARAEFGLTPGGYVYLVRTAFAAEVLDVRPIRGTGGAVTLYVLARSGDGTAPPELLSRIIAAFTPEDMNQSTDILSVVSAEIDTVRPAITIVVPSGPDKTAVKTAALSSLAAYAERQHRLGAGVYRDAIASAGRVGDAITVRVADPAIDRPGALHRAPHIVIDPDRIEVVRGE